MTTIENSETKLNELTQLMRKLKTKNAELKRKFGAVQESIEALESHGMDNRLKLELNSLTLQKQ